MLDAQAGENSQPDRAGRPAVRSGSLYILMQTTMTNPSLPPEILDCVIDLLHDEPDALNQCCFASKSWVPRTRRHLFADIQFRSASNLKSWKKMFPDAANSPAHHVRTLLVCCPQLVTMSDAEEGGWIQAFSGVTSLSVDNGDWYIDPPEVSLAPFYGFSPTLKSLRVRTIRLPHTQIFDLIHSFPLLEHLSLSGRTFAVGNDSNPHGPRTIVPSTSPSFTGSLDLAILGGMWSAASQLLELPNGLHFRKLAFLWDHVEDLWWIMELVVRCSHTLESLDIKCAFHRTFGGICTRTNGLSVLLVVPELASLNFSKATKLREAVFRPESKSIEWITMALQTITHEHQAFQRISIYVPFHLTLFRVGADMGQYLGETASRWWSDLDQLLVQFWESRSIRSRVGCARQGEAGQSTEYCVGCLLPEATKIGIIDPV